MKKSELFFSAVQVPVDFLMILGASATAFWIRESEWAMTTFELGSLANVFSFSDFFRVALTVAPIFVLIFAIEGLYDIRATRKFWREFLKVFTATSIGLMLIIMLIFLKREWFSSRFIILLAWLLMTFYVSFARLALNYIQKWLVVKKGIGVHRVLLIGRNGKLCLFSNMIRRRPRLGYKIIDEIETARLNVVKKIEKEKGIDEIIVCDSSIPDEDLEKLIDYCAINNITYRFVPTALQTIKFEMRSINGEPILEVMHTPLEGWGKILKRIFDIAGALIAIILTLPILVVVAILIKLEDKEGPVIYKNKRVGSRGKEIFVYKLRYFKWEYCIDKKNPNFEKALEFEKKLIEERSVRKGPLYKIKDDPRKTKIGTFIEKYSIDEFPQFFNVLKGDMSLVGPRPHQKREVEKYLEYHRRLLTIKPGATGLAQVSGRSDLNFEDEYKLDLYYIENWSLLLDIQIILKTIGVLVKRRNNNS
ncbi:MAG: sugar transferase [Candidatus Moranbacteria bacterium]|nr:sugar transferase [Candidatus Moranbacteria bacterium]